MTFGVREVCLVVAIVLFVIAAVGYVPPRGSLIAAGLGFVSVALLVGG